MSESAHQSLRRRILLAGLFFIAMLAMGTAGYVWLGGGRWSWFDALYMTVVTTSTVGFGEVLDDLAAVPGARAFTMVLILVGSGVLLTLTSTITAFIIEGDLTGTLRRRRMERTIDELLEHVIVCGCGATGTSVVDSLLAQGRSVVVVDQNADKLEALRRRHPHVPTVVGDATQEELLRRVGIDRAHGLVAALSDDRDDLFLVFTARHLNATMRIVAKTVDPGNARKMNLAGADFVVSPASLGGAKLATALGRPSVSHFLDAMTHDQEVPHHIDEVVIPIRSPLIGRTLAGSGILGCPAVVLAIRDPTGQTLYNPAPSTRLQAGQTLIVFVSTSARSTLDDLLKDR